MKSIVRFALEKGGMDYNIMFPNRYTMGYYSSGNPTCVHYKNRLILNSRFVNYKKILQSEYADFIANQKSQTYYLRENGFNSRNITCEIGINKEPIKIKEINYGEGFDEFYKGFEDCRLIVWDDKLYAYGTRWDKEPGKGIICIYELSDNLVPIDCIYVKSPMMLDCEKNWGAIEDKPFHFIYKVNGTIVIKVNRDGNCDIVYSHEEDTRYNENFIKGSTPVIRYSDDEYISLVHRTTYKKEENGIEKSTYQTAFVFYDNEFNITRLSDWFVFRTDLCEFTCGLMIHDNIIYIPYSQIDCTVNMMEMPVEKVEEFINAEDKYPLYDRDYIYDLAKKHELNGQIFTSYVLYNYAAILSKENDEKKKESVIKTFAGLLLELDSIKSNTHIEKLKSCINKAKEVFDNSIEFDYLLAIVEKFEGNIESSAKHLKNCQNFKYELNSEFLKFINVDYL